MQEQAARGIAREVLELVRGIGGHGVDAVHLVPALEERQRERRAEASAGADDDDGLADRLGGSAGRRRSTSSTCAASRAKLSIVTATPSSVLSIATRPRALVDVADAQHGSAPAGVVPDEPERDAAEEAVESRYLHPDDVAAPGETTRSRGSNAPRTETVGELVELRRAGYEIATLLRAADSPRSGTAGTVRMVRAPGIAGVSIV